MSTTPMVNQSKQSYFGWAWELTINTTPDADGNQQSIVVSSSEWDPETLRIVFDVNLPAYKSLWFARISIYNMNKATAQTILTQGMSVTLKAGYQTQPFGTIFEGEIYQPMWEMENVVDFKLTLMCYTGMKETIANFSSVQGSPNSTQAAIVASIAANAFHPITVGAIDTTALSQTKYPRARPFFGDPIKFIDRVARANNMQSWVGFNGLNVSSLEADSAIATLTYSPTSGIIGTPQQTQDGIEFQVYLDARVTPTQPPLQVKIDNAPIRQLPKYPGDYPTILDKDGLYIVMGVNHVGDSRSNGGNWYTRIVAVTSVGGKLALQADALDPKVELDRRSPI
jgi:hypothetical protein